MVLKRIILILFPWVVKLFTKPRKNHPSKKIYEYFIKYLKGRKYQATIGDLTKCYTVTNCHLTIQLTEDKEYIYGLHVFGRLDKVTLNIGENPIGLVHQVAYTKIVEIGRKYFHPNIKVSVFPDEETMKMFNVLIDDVKKQMLDMVLQIKKEVNNA
jgi:hypothetical protein